VKTEKSQQFFHKSAGFKENRDQIFANECTSQIDRQEHIECSRLQVIRLSASGMLLIQRKHYCRLRTLQHPVLDFCWHQ